MNVFSAGVHLLASFNVRCTDENAPVITLHWNNKMWCFSAIRNTYTGRCWLVTELCHVILNCMIICNGYLMTFSPLT